MVEEGTVDRPQPTRQLNCVVAALYALSVDRLGLLKRLSDNSLVGNLVLEIDGLKVSRDLIDSGLEIDFLERHLDLSHRERFSILDIGAGYGRLPYRLTESFPNLARVYATDAIAESTFLCDWYLRFRGVAERAITIPLVRVEEELPTGEIDVATNVHSFTECPLAAIVWWLDLLGVKRVRHLMIVPNVGTRLASRETDDRRHDLTAALAD